MNDTYQQPGRWHDFILTPEHRPASEPLTHIMSYTIKNLVPGAYYEAIVQAKNRYGWNEVSTRSQCSSTMKQFLQAHRDTSLKKKWMKTSMGWV